MLFFRDIGLDRVGRTGTKLKTNDVQYLDVAKWAGKT